MVNIKYFLAVFICFTSFIHALDPDVSTEIDAYGLYENMPINVMITVSHASDQKVDVNSFKLKGKPIKVEFVKDVEISASPSLILSIYRYKQDPQPQGLHLFPEVTVTVGGKQIESIGRTYMISPAPTQSAGQSVQQQVQPAAVTAPSPAPTTPRAPASVSAPASAPAPSPVSSPAADSGKKIFLKLEANVDPDKPVYPGQRLKFSYTYLFNGNIDLSKEQIPLLDAEGFKKIGEKEFDDKQQGDTTIHKIIQTVEAVKPGTYSFGPSVIEGYTTVTTADGTEVRVQPVLHAEAPNVTVTVKAFPEQNKPTSFNGAIGKFDFKAELQGSSKVAVGDAITLLLTFTGTGDLQNLPMPDVCCQPGFSGVFKTSDLPPVGVVQNNSKTFTVTMQPLSSSIKEIPSIEFSSFIPESESYYITKSKPIPLTVQPLPRGAVQPDAVLPKKEVPVSEKVAKPSPIEIQTIYLIDSSSLNNLFFGTWAVLWAIPIGIALLIIQILLKQAYKEKALKEKKPKAIKLMEMAEQNKDDPSLFYYYLTQALTTRLYEIKEISAPDIAIENLPDTGKSKEVKDFWAYVDADRFSGKKQLSSEDVLLKAKEIFSGMRKEFKLNG